MTSQIGAASMASDLRLHWESDSSSSEGSEEYIEGVEYASRSVDGSDSGRSLADFLRDGDSASSESPSFYRAIDNEKSLSPLHLPRGLAGVVHLPTSPFAWSFGSGFRKRMCFTPPDNPQASPRCCIPAACQHRAGKMVTVGEDLHSPVRKRVGLGRKRRRVILSQESEEEQHTPPLSLSKVRTAHREVARRVLDAAKRRAVKKSKPRYNT
ncbi:hypothetical protein KFL_004770010 [Klebsormidium nitens]|uniref:Uncharacterized protein n=1 Tax=Klebsormidium nitens TaxID=105231 RepID=A0A1Y1IEG3_KLENI|nr:hypothetical protein KFL_004770010 [Klebsormidium nitens]|eukprot:GAQ88993.1 hypothetical protein KFL_004770010 [Klebsormidium nitens]